MVLTNYFTCLSVDPELQSYDFQSFGSQTYFLLPAEFLWWKVDLEALHLELTLLWQSSVDKTNSIKVKFVYNIVGLIG